MAAIDIENRLVMSLCRAFVGRVPAELRYVLYEVSPGRVAVECAFAEAPSADVQHEMWDAQEDAAADFAGSHKVEFTVTVAPPPAAAPATGTFFYQRYEPKR